MIVKRFVAGAVCPRCGEMDKIRSYTTEEGSFRDCVNCDFEEKQLAQVEQKELGTRVNQYEEASDSSVQVVNIVEPPRKN